MVTTAHGTTADATQHARAAHLRDLLEPWSLRKLQARTGLGRNYLAGRLNGDQALSISDIEVLAPVIRMTPEELFVELLNASAGDAPTGSSGAGNGAFPRSLYGEGTYRLTADCSAIELRRNERPDYHEGELVAFASRPRETTVQGDGEVIHVDFQARKAAGL